MQAFSDELWIDALIRSTGMEPSGFKERVKWHLLARMIPLVENNYNFCELGPRGTGKSHIYKETLERWRSEGYLPQDSQTAGVVAVSTGR